MAIHDDVVAYQATRTARPASPASPISSARPTGQAGPAAQLASATGTALAAGQHLSGVAAGRRPFWRSLLVVLLGVFSLGVTAVYVATLTTDFRQHHWAGALDASRDAVPAAVGWAALLLIFFARSAAAADQASAAEDHAVTERQRQAALARDSVRRAEQRVQRLAERLAELSALAGQGGQNRQLDRQIGATAARLDLARQWAVGARAALAATQPDLEKATATQSSHVRGPRPPASRVALLPVPVLPVEVRKAAFAEDDRDAQYLLGGVYGGARRDGIRVRLVQVAQSNAAGRHRDVVRGHVQLPDRFVNVNWLVELLRAHALLGDAHPAPSCRRGWSGWPYPRPRIRRTAAGHPALGCYPAMAGACQSEHGRFGEVIRLR